MSKELNKKIEEALCNFYKEADREIIISSLKENIKDYDTYEKKKKQIIFLAKAKANQKHNENLLQLTNKFQEALLQNIEKPIALLKQLIQGNYTSLALYNNLEKLSKEDIIEIIKDKNLIELLEKLEENDKNH